MNATEEGSATGRGTRDGTSVTGGGTSMGNTGRPMEWKQEDLKLAGELIKNHTAEEVGEIFSKSKNSVLGVLYREKIKNGYVPPADSKYTKPRMRSRFKSDPALGERKCYICEKTFIKSGRFDVFCHDCKRTGRVT